MKLFKKKPLLIFLVFMLVITVLSKTIYSYFIPNVKISDIRQGSIKKTIKVTAIVETPRLKSIYSDISARIATQKIIEKERIKKGDELISFNTDEMDYKLKYEQLELEKLKGFTPSSDADNIYLQIQKQEEKIEKLENEKKNLESLFDAGAVPKQDLIDKQLEISGEKIELAIQQKAMDKLKSENKSKNRLNCIEETQKELEIKMLEDNIKLSSNITSPYDGTIMKNYIDGKKLVNQGDKLCDILEDGTSYQCNFPLEKEYIDLLSIGDTVNIKLKSISNKNISAKIVSIYDTIDTKKIEVKFDELENVYMQPAEITYENESDVYDMVLPNSAIKYDGKNYYINVIDKKENFIGTDYTARRVFVRILDKNDSATAISSEIAINEKVIIYSNKFIEQGEKVYVKSIE